MARCTVWVLLGLAVPILGQAQASERVAAPVRVSGTVFADRNENGVRDPGEAGLPGVVVSDQVDLTTTGADGRFTLDAAGYGVVFVEQPDGYLVRGSIWRKAEAGGELLFPLVATPSSSSFIFLHASDTHINPTNVDRTRRLRAIADSVRPAFVLISGDLVRDALRVNEAEATGYYQLFMSELAQFRMPVFTVPGNHEIFGIERHHSLVSRTHPLYGKRMYRSYLGPDYYGFTYGGVHFVGLNSVDYDDLWYSGHVDSLQLKWLASEVAALKPGTRVVTFNHIPLVTAVDHIDGFMEEGPAPTVIRIMGKSYFRHSVRNFDEVLDVIGDRLEIALGGHMHMREMLRYETPHGTRRFNQTSAVTTPDRGIGPLGLRSGVTLYRVTNGRVDDGTFIPLNP
jgi:Calcineurin-like phosphoesterase